MATEGHKPPVEGVTEFDKTQLKHQTTVEKNPLPDKDVIEEEKREVEQRKSIEEFDSTNLKHVHTRSTESTVITQERILSDVGKFAKDNLKHTQIAEPSAGRMYTQERILEDVGKFGKDKLKHTETMEKNTLPTKETIAQEKTA